jgi:hypothetical protein
MRVKITIVLLLLGMVSVITAVTMITQPVIAQCSPNDPACQPPANTQPPDTKEPRKPRLTKTATYAPVRIPSKTPTQTETETPTVTPTLTATHTETPVAANTETPMAAGIPATETATPSVAAAPVSGCFLCGREPWFWLAGGGVLMVLIGLLLFLFFRRPLSLDPASRPSGTGPFPSGNENGTIMPPQDGLLPFMEKDGKANYTVTINDFNELDDGSKLLPAIQKGVNENATVTIADVGDLGGGFESATLTVHDVGDVSPDVIRGAREAANNPGGVQVDANPGGVHLDDSAGPGIL